MMIKEWIEGYNQQHENDILAAMREIMQEVTLAALSRTDFYEQAAFYGGTALRIFYGLDRFSEDLDFSLLASDAQFSLEPYFAAIKTEFEAMGMTISINEKIKKEKNNIESAFLKSETVWKELTLEGIVKQANISINSTIKIKIEIDRDPPGGFDTEEKLLLRPFSFYVKCFTLSSLFAGKMHALLFRKWKNRVKGRDWYDLEWYVKKGVPLNLQHFLQRAKDSKDWTEDTISQDQFITLLKNRIKEVSFDSIKDDVIRFIKNDEVLQIWSPAYFKDLSERLKFK
jgi:predicted nucleotidyltransferase component of viral defense system